MDLDLSEEQQMIIDMTRGMLEEHSTVDVVREMEDDPKGFPDELWEADERARAQWVVDPGESRRGRQSLLEAALVYEELGRALAPVPHFVSCVLSAGVLLEAGSDAQRDEWLPRIANGDAVLTPAWLEPERSCGESGIALEAKLDGDDYVLNGVKRSVPFAGAATRLIVLARSNQGVELLLVDPTASGIKLTQHLSQGREPHFRVDFENVRVPSSARIGGAGSGWDTWNTVMHDGIVLVAAQAVGGAARCLEETVAYANERVQFDKPLGAFQALAHYMADASTSIDGGRVLVP